jgi:hypothetical protein
MGRGSSVYTKADIALQNKIGQGRCMRELTFRPSPRGGDSTEQVWQWMQCHHLQMLLSLYMDIDNRWPPSHHNLLSSLSPQEEHLCGQARVMGSPALTPRGEQREDGLQLHSVAATPKSERVNFYHPVGFEDFLCGINSLRIGCDFESLNGWLWQCRNTDSEVTKRTASRNGQVLSLVIG